MDSFILNENRALNGCSRMSICHCATVQGLLAASSPQKPIRTAEFSAKLTQHDHISPNADVRAVH